MFANRDPKCQSVIVRLSGHMVYTLGAAIDAWPKFTASANTFGLLIDKARSTNQSMGRLPHEICNMISGYLYLYTLRKSRQAWTKIEHAMFHTWLDGSSRAHGDLKVAFSRYRELNADMEGVYLYEEFMKMLMRTDERLFLHATNKVDLCASFGRIFMDEEFKRCKRAFERQLRIKPYFQLEFRNDLRREIYATIQHSVQDEDQSLRINPYSVLWLGEYFLGPGKKTVISKENEDNFRAGLAKLGLDPSRPQLLPEVPYDETLPTYQGRGE